MTLPRYVPLGGNVEHSPPISAERTRIYAWLMPVEPDLLDRALHERLNEPSQGAVNAITAVPFVVFYVSVMPAIRMHENVGWYRERETGVMLLGVDRSTLDLFLTMEYLFVDSGVAMANGREVFGFPKQIGTWDTDDTWLEDQSASAPATTPSYFSLRTLGVERYGATAWAAPYELWRLRREGDAEPPARFGSPAAVTELVQDALRALGSRDTDTLGISVPYRRPLGQGGAVTLDLHPYEPRNPLDQARMPVSLAALPQLGYDIVNDIAQNRVSTVLLKQVRSASQPGKACYSAVLDLRFERNWRSGGVLPGEWWLDVRDLDSAPMVQEYGWHGPVRSLMGMWAEYDFVYHPAFIRWSANGDVDA